MFICCPRITIRTRYLELPKRRCSFPGNELGRWPMPVGGRGAQISEATKMITQRGPVVTEVNCTVSVSRDVALLTHVRTRVW